jgi:hypothetical protein
MQGGILITDIVNGVFCKKRYFDYTLEEAKALFLEEFGSDDPT